MAHAPKALLRSMNELSWWGHRTKERRSHKDILLKVLTVFGFLNLAILITAAIVFTIAKPDGFDSTYGGLPLKYYLQPSLLLSLYQLAVLGAVISGIGLAINAKRLKRKYDSIRINLIVLGLISLAGIIAYHVIM